HVNSIPERGWILNINAVIEFDGSQEMLAPFAFRSLRGTDVQLFFDLTRETPGFGFLTQRNSRIRYNCVQLRPGFVQPVGLDQRLNILPTNDWPVLAGIQQSFRQLRHQVETALPA